MTKITFSKDCFEYMKTTLSMTFMVKWLVLLYSWCRHVRFDSRAGHVEKLTCLLSFGSRRSDRNKKGTVVIFHFHNTRALVILILEQEMLMFSNNYLPHKILYLSIILHYWLRLSKEHLSYIACTVSVINSFYKL